MNNLIAALQAEPIIKRIKELEGYIDRNPKLNHKIASLKQIQKRMVNAKEFNQVKQYQVYQTEYENIYQEILNFPFVEEYLELLEEANQLLLSVTNIIEEKINNELHKLD